MLESVKESPQENVRRVSSVKFGSVPGKVRENTSEGILGQKLSSSKSESVPEKVRENTPKF